MNKILKSIIFLTFFSSLTNIYTADIYEKLTPQELLTELHKLEEKHEKIVAKFEKDAVWAFFLTVLALPPILKRNDAFIVGLVFASFATLNFMRAIRHYQEKNNVYDELKVLKERRRCD